MALSIIAKNPSISVGYKKLMPVLQLISKKNAVIALNLLQFCRVGCAREVVTVLNGAIRNATHNFAVRDISKLFISDIKLGRGRFLKRFHARARGRGNKILKHSSNLLIELTVID